MYVWQVVFSFFRVEYCMVRSQLTFFLITAMSFIAGSLRTHTYIQHTYICIRIYSVYTYIHTYIQTNKCFRIERAHVLTRRNPLCDAGDHLGQCKTLCSWHECVCMYVCVCICSMPGASTYVRCRRRADEHSTYPSSLQTAPTT